MRRSNYLKIILAVASVVLISGCSINLGATQTTTDGGIWKSVDSGKVWSQNVLVPTTNGKVATIAGAEIRKIIFDPSDASAIYLATEKNGIIYSYDGGSSWQQFKQLKSGKIYSIAVDPKNKCVLYSLSENKLYKSIDCGRNWDVAYYHQNSSVPLTDLVIDFSNPSIIYMVDGVGEIMKSINNGQSWNTVYREQNETLFADIIMDPLNSKIIYGATLTNGIYKSIDGGVTWNSLGEGLKSYSGSSGYRKLIINKATPGGLILISKFGMLRSNDGGNSWNIVELLPAPGATVLYAVAVNPKNSQEIYYTTANTLIKTIDGGKTWSSKKLPFSKVPNFMAVNPIDTNMVYIGTKLPVKD